MLFLLFHLGQERYALEARRVVEVVPLLALTRMPHAPRGLAGIFNYRGQPVPALDLCELALGHPAIERMSTRIIIVNYATADGPQLLGLIAEQATDMLRKEARDFVQSGVNIDGAPYLGPVLMDAGGAIQWVLEQNLLPEQVRSFLFSQPAQLIHETR